MRSYIPVLLFFICISSINAQLPEFAWAKSFGGKGIEGGRSIIDNQGNVFSLGIFQDTVATNTSAVVSNGGFDIFVSKRDIYGNLVWIKSIGGLYNDYSGSITIDLYGNIYLTGSFGNTVDFDPNLGQFLVSTSNPTESDFFLLKFDGAGNFIWVKTFSSIGGTIYTQKNGELLMIGSFRVTADFDPSASVFNLTPLGGLDAMFILKLSNSGNFISVKQIASKGAGSIESSSLAIDSIGNQYFIGNYHDSVDFDPGPNKFYLTTIREFDNSFILKLDSFGNFIWAKSILGDQSSFGYTIYVEPSGDILVSGLFSGIIDADPDINTYNLSAIGRYDLYIVKLNSNGNLIWAKSIGNKDPQGAPRDIFSIINHDKKGNIYAYGTLLDSLDVDPGPNVVTLSAKGYQDLFLIKFDQNCNYLSSIQIGGTQKNRDNIVGNSIFIGNNGDIFTSGFFIGTIDFDPDTTVYNLSINGSNNPNNVDFFIQKMSQSGFVGIEDSNRIKDELSIYPNPNTGQFTIASKLNGDYKIYNQLGQEIKSFKKYEKEDFIASLKEFNNGIYFLKGKNGTKEVYKKIVVSK